MISTVKAVAAARKTARYVCSPRFLNASSGPYADEESPSAPSPTQARNAISEMCRNRCGSCRSLGPPRRRRFNRCPGRGRSGCGGTAEGAGVLMRPGEASIAPRRQFEPPPPAHRNSGLQNAIPLVTDACISQLRVSEAMSMATAARPLQSFLDVESGLPVLPATTTELRAFLLAQLHWERFRA